MHGMNRPNCGGQPRWSFSSKNQERQLESEKNVTQVQQEIQDVVSGRLDSVFQNRVVEQKRSGRDRPVQLVGRRRPPVMRRQDLFQVLNRSLAYSRVLFDD